MQFCKKCKCRSVNRDGCNNSLCTSNHGEPGNGNAKYSLIPYTPEEKKKSVFISIINNQKTIISNLETIISNQERQLKKDN